jgi:hypothetical protein
MPEISKKQLSTNREKLIKQHRQKKGFICSSKIPTKEWYENYDKIFKKEK